MIGIDESAQAESASTRHDVRSAEVANVGGPVAVPTCTGWRCRTDTNGLPFRRPQHQEVSSGRFHPQIATKRCKSGCRADKQIFKSWGRTASRGCEDFQALDNSSSRVARVDQPVCHNAVVNCERSKVSPSRVVGDAWNGLRPRLLQSAVGGEEVETSEFNVSATVEEPPRGSPNRQRVFWRAPSVAARRGQDSTSDDEPLVRPTSEETLSPRDIAMMWMWFHQVAWRFCWTVWRKILQSGTVM